MLTAHEPVVPWSSNNYPAATIAAAATADVEPYDREHAAPVERTVLPDAVRVASEGGYGRARSRFV